MDLQLFEMDRTIGYGGLADQRRRGREVEIFLAQDCFVYLEGFWFCVVLCCALKSETGAIVNFVAVILIAWWFYPWERVVVGVDRFVFVVGWWLVCSCWGDVCTIIGGCFPSYSLLSFNYKEINHTCCRHHQNYYSCNQADQLLTTLLLVSLSIIQIIICILQVILGLF